MIFKALHILLAINLLISSIGLRTFEHICSINGTTFSIFVKAKSCCTKKKIKSCSGNGCTQQKSNQGTIIKKKPCCEDKSSFKKLNLTATKVTKTVNSEIQPFFNLSAADFKVSNYDFISENEKTIKSFSYRPPPLPLDNLMVLYQSFLC